MLYSYHLIMESSAGFGYLAYRPWVIGQLCSTSQLNLLYGGQGSLCLAFHVESIHMRDGRHPLPRTLLGIPCSPRRGAEDPGTGVQ